MMLGVSFDFKAGYTSTGFEQKPDLLGRMQNGVQRHPAKK
jgi:hypothetical protein